MKKTSTKLKNLLIFTLTSFTFFLIQFAKSETEKCVQHCARCVPKSVKVVMNKPGAKDDI
jgi:hypothetical protein